MKLRTSSLALFLFVLSLALPVAAQKEFTGWTVGGQGGIPFAGFTLPAQTSDPGCFAFPTPTSTNCNALQIEQTTNLFVPGRGLVIVPGTTRNIPSINAGGGKLDFTAPTCTSSGCSGNAELTRANSDGVAVSSGGRSKGFLGGGQVGYDHQFVKLVLGGEMEFSGSTVNGTAQAAIFLPATALTNCVGPGAPNPCTATIATMSRKASSTWTGSLRARAGWVMGHTLVYATGGPAITSVTVDAVDTFTNTLSNGQPCPCPPGAGSAQASTGVTGLTVFSTSQDTHIQLGWTAGAGFERSLWKRFRWGAEYRHLSAGNKSFPGTAPLNVTVNPSTATVTGAGSPSTCCEVKGPSGPSGPFLAGGVVSAPIKINYSDDRIVGRFSFKLW
jgi:opacity protein-like surface antigen